MSYYERFLDLSPALVMATMWLVGVTLLAASVLALYLCARLLMRGLI